MSRAHATAMALRIALCTLALGGFAAGCGETLPPGGLLEPDELIPAAIPESPDNPNIPYAPGVPGAPGLAGGNGNTVAVPVATPPGGVAPVSIRFDGTASHASPAVITEYYWDFGDGYTAEGEKVEHTYTISGIYTAWLTVRDSAQGMGEEALTIVVLPLFELVAEADPADPLTGRFAAYTVDPLPDLPPYELQWDFGDGVQAQGAEVTHRYAQAGQYVVRLAMVFSFASVPCGEAAFEARGQATPAGTLFANAGPDQHAESGQRVTLDGSSSVTPPGVGPIFYWQQRSGPPVQLDDPSAVRPSFYAPEVPGETQLLFELTVSDGVNSHSDKVIVIVRPAQGPNPRDNQPPVAVAMPDFSVVDEDRNGEEEVTLDAGVCPHGSCDPDGQIVRYIWSEGATVLAEGDTPQMTIPLPVGQHPLTLKVVDDGGKTDEDSVTITVLDTAVLLVTPTSGLSSRGPAGGPFTPGSLELTIANAGERPLEWNATRQADWIDLSPAAGTLAAGQIATLVVSLNASAAALAPGSYADTIQITNHTNGQGNTSRPVELEVTSGGMLTVSPYTPLTSAGLQGGPFSPNAKIYTVRNSGGVTIDWSVSHEQSWTTLSRTSGALAPGEEQALTVTINAQAATLVPGAYVDVLRFVNETNGSGDTNRTVALGVLTPGALVVMPNESLAASGMVGGPFSPGSQQYTLYNSGQITLAWTASKSLSWVSLSATGGQLAPGASTTVTVSLNSGANSLAAGAYADAVHFVNVTNGSGNTTRTVTLDVLAPAGLAVSPAGGLTSSGPLGGPFSPNTRAYTLRNTGGVSLSWSAGSNASWATVAPTGGTLAAGQEATVTVTLNSQANNLPAGAHLADISFVNQTNGSGNTTRPVALGILNVGELEVTPSGGFVANGPQGGPFTPASQQYTLRNSGQMALDWSASSGQTWLTLSSTSGRLQPSESVVVTAALSAHAGALTPGNYVDLVQFRNETNGSGNTARTVTLTVVQPGRLYVAPSGGFTAVGPQGGPFTPSSQDFTVRNTGEAPIAWSVSHSENWVDLSRTGGTLAPGAEETVTATLNAAANALPPGGYSDEFRFINETNGDGNAVRAASLGVLTSGALSVSPSSAFTPSGVQGGPFSPSSQAYTLTNTGQTALAWSATKSQSWLSLSATSGQLAPGASVVVTVSLGSGVNSLAPGAHADIVQFRNDSNGQGNANRTVSLEVLAPGRLTVTPAGSMTSSGPQGGPFSPSSVTYTLRNEGQVALSWAASKSQNWIDLSRTSGSLAPGATENVVVSLNSSANSLIVGTHNASATFTNATNGLGNTSRAVTLNVQAPGALSVTPTGGLSSSGPAGGPFSPLSQTYTLRNTGGATINWTAARTQSWVSLSKTSGLLPAGGTDTVIVSFGSGANSLGAGSYSDTVTFTNTTNNQGNGTRPVSLTVQSSSFTISGRVLFETNGLSGVTLAGLPGNPQSNGAGEFSVTVSPGWSGTVTPQLAGYQFSPTSRTYANVAQNLSGQDFVGTLAGGTQAMRTASRTSGVMPLGVFFDVVDTDDPPWTSDVVQPRGFVDQPTNCTGVRITGVSFSNNLGGGTLAYTHSGQTLHWTAPGASAGPAVDVSAGGNFDLPSSGGGTLRVWVNPAELPAANRSDAVQVVAGGLNADWASFHYAWDFGDPAPGGAPNNDPRWYWEHGAKKSDGSWFPKNQAFGWNAAHVYEAAGVYTVRLTIIDDEDGEHAYSQEIEVLAEPPGGWITYHFTEHGDDVNGDGSVGSPFRSFAKAMTLAGNNVRLLFNRGDEFPVTEAGTPRVAGSFMMAAYGIGDRPRFTLLGTADFLNCGGNEDGRLVDLWADGDYPAQSSPGAGIVNLGDYGLALRCRVQDVTAAYSLNWNKASIVQNCEGQNTKAYTFWVGANPPAAILGCASSDGNNEALLRVYTKKFLLAHCVFQRPSWKETIRFHSADAHVDKSGDWYLIQHNRLIDVQVSIAPDSNTIMPTHVVVEGNDFDSPNTSGKNAIYNYGCNWLTVRNNLSRSSNSQNFVGFIAGYNGQRFMHNVAYIYNNVMHYSGSGWIRFLSTDTDLAATASCWIVRNNIVHAPNATDGVSRIFRLRSGSGTAAGPLVESDYNCWFVPNLLGATLFEDEVGSMTFAAWRTAGQDTESITDAPLLADPGAGDLRLLTGSPCVDRGWPDAVRRCRIDSDSLPRPAGQRIDIGAAERQP